MLHDEPLFAVAAHHNLVIALWRDAPEVSWVRSLVAASERHVAQHERKCALVNLVVSGTPSFREDARNELMKMSRRRDLYPVVAHVVQLDGLVGAAVRAFLSTLLVLSRTKAPIKVFAEPTAAGDWLVPQLGDDWTCDTVVTACESVVARLGWGERQVEGRR